MTLVGVKLNYYACSFTFVLSDWLFPEGDNYTVVYLEEVPLQGMSMFTGEGVYVR